MPRLEITCAHLLQMASAQFLAASILTKSITKPTSSLTPQEGLELRLCFLRSRLIRERRVGNYALDCLANRAASALVVGEVAKVFSRWIFCHYRPHDS